VDYWSSIFLNLERALPLFWKLLTKDLQLGNSGKGFKQLVGPILGDYPMFEFHLFFLPFWLGTIYHYSLGKNPISIFHFTIPGKNPTEFSLGVSYSKKAFLFNSQVSKNFWFSHPH